MLLVVLGLFGFPLGYCWLCCPRSWKPALRAHSTKISSLFLSCVCCIQDIKGLCVYCCVLWFVSFCRTHRQLPSSKKSTYNKPENEGCRKTINSYLFNFPFLHMVLISLPASRDLILVIICLPWNSEPGDLSV